MGFWVLVSGEELDGSWPLAFGSFGCLSVQEWKLGCQGSFPFDDDSEEE